MSATEISSTAGRKPMSAGRYRLLLAAVLVLAAYLRFQQIFIQWLTDDEWHAVHKVISGDGYLSIMSSFGQADYSIPLTLLYKLLADTVGLSEIRMRLPMLVTGMAFLLLAVARVRDRLGQVEALVFGYLIAVSPLLVNYSRNARPYIITLLLSALAVWALAQWVRQGGRRHAVGYLCCAWAASYLHLIAAPFVLGPLAVLVWVRSTGADRSAPGLRGAMALSLLSVAGAVALILPPMIHDWSAMAVKTGSSLPDADTLTGVWSTWIGSSSAGVVLLTLAFAAYGAGRLRDAFAVELAMWLCGLVAVLAAIVVLRPAWVQNPQTLGRYLLPALPLLLAAAAAGIVRLAAKMRGGGALASAGMASLLTVGTPHWELIARPNNFTLHSYYQFDYRESHNPVRTAFARFVPSPFWNSFAGMPAGPETIAIGGQLTFESYFALYPRHQPIHRQVLVKLQTGGACGPARAGEAFVRQGVDLRNAVSLALPNDVTRKGVGWVVLEYEPEAASSPEAARQHADYIAECKAFLANRYGPAVYDDGRIHAFRVVQRVAVASRP